MNKKIQQNAMVIARQNFLNGITTIDSEKPFKWASGTLNPIYNDNRMNLGFPISRRFIVQALLDIIAENNIQFDALLGTSMAGIPWAAILAYELKKDLIIIHNEKIIQFKEADLFMAPAGVEAIACTIPLSIPFAAVVAHQRDLPLMLVRPAPKQHGKNKQIEGSAKKDVKRVYLFDMYEDEGYFTPAVAALEAENFSVEGASLVINSRYVITLETLNGIVVLSIEDLVSTGGSSFKEIDVCRKAGATVKDQVCIFHYQLPKALKIAEEAGVTVHTVLTYDQSVEKGIAMGVIPKEAKEMLLEWKATQETWGTKYFPNGVLTK